MAEMDRAGPTKSWYLLAGFVAGSSVLVTGILGAARASELVDQVYGFERFNPPGTVTVPVEEAGSYSIYYEADSASHSGDDLLPADFGLAVQGPDGAAVPVTESDVTYAWGSRKGAAVGTFDAEQPGTYAVAADWSGGGWMAVGESLPGGVLYGFGTTLFVGVALVLASLVLTVVVALRRRRVLRDEAGWAAPPDDPERGRHRVVVGAGVGVVVVVVVGAALAAWKDGSDGGAYLEPASADQPSTSTTLHPCTEMLNEDLDMCGPTPEELREMNLDYADRMEFTGDYQAALAVADEVRAALVPLAARVPTPSEADLHQALNGWDVTLSSNAVRTSGTAFAVAVDGGCVFGSVHEGVVDVEVGGYVDDGGCLASSGH